MIIVEKVNYKNIFNLMLDQNIKLSKRINTSLDFIPEIYKLKKAEKQKTPLNRQHFMVSHKLEDKMFIDGMVGIQSIDTVNKKARLCVLPFSKVDYLVNGAKIIVNDYCIDQLHLNKLYTHIDYEAPDNIFEFWSKFGYDSKHLDFFCDDTWWVYIKILNNKEKTK